MKNEDLLPPIIKDLIDSIRNESLPVHVRDTYCARLENILDCSADVVNKFRAKQVKHYTIKKKQKA